MQKTVLYDSHVKSGGKMVDFAGWQLPVHYGSLADEHIAVREKAGMFDVSHMTIVDVAGARAKDFLQHLLSNDVAGLQKQGAALYSCMLNHEGGIIDDLIVYHFSETNYRLVVNAATREKDLAWINAQAADFETTITEQPDLAMIAVQGPAATDRVHEVLTPEMAAACRSLGRYEAVCIDDWFIAATGYTGEDGYEIALPPSQAEQLWQSLLESGVTPCGLGARDTLRLEAGMNLYGTDMSEDDSPLTSGLAWTVAFEPDSRDFIGRSALEVQRSAGPSHQLVGFVLDGKGVLRGGQLLYKEDTEIGVITSGTHSPSLKQSIAFARVKADQVGDCEVQIRRNRLPVRLVKRVFVRNGRPVT